MTALVGYTSNLARLMQIRTPQVIHQAIEDLPPYPSLLVVAVPLAIVEPLKLAAVVVMGDGHLITGTLSILCAYAISLFITERLFGIVKPKLLRLPWFAAIWRPLFRYVAVCCAGSPRGSATTAKAYGSGTTDHSSARRHAVANANAHGP